MEPEEDIREAARRELREEAGLDVPDLALRGVVHESGLVGHHFVLFVFVGQGPPVEPRSPEGLELRWHPIGALDALPLVHDVEVLLPLALASGEPFFAVETYDGGDRRTSLRIDGVIHGQP